MGHRAQRIEAPRDPQAAAPGTPRLRRALFERGRLVEDPNRFCLTVERHCENPQRPGLSSLARAGRLESGELASVTDVEQPDNRFPNRHGAFYRIIGGSGNP
jgi:hypothetical protein